MSCLIWHGILSDRIIRNLFLADILGSIESGLVNFINTLHLASTYQNTFYLGLNLVIPVTASLFVLFLSARIDASDKKKVMVNMRSLDFVLDSLRFLDTRVNRVLLTNHMSFIHRVQHHEHRFVTLI